MRTGIEMLVAEAFELGDRLFHFGPLVGRKLRIREHPIGDEPALEQPLRHAGSLRQRRRALLGLPHLLLALGESVRLFDGRSAHVYIPVRLPFFGERGQSFAGFVTVSGGQMRLDEIRAG